MTDKTDLYKEAMKFAKEKASISYVQRKCRCSYNDAERMLEQMVSEGVIGTYNGRKGGEAAGAGGVQALSAAPNGCESVIDAARSGLQDSEPSAFDNSGYRAFAETVLDAVEEGLSALAASPTPPVEQQATTTEAALGVEPVSVYAKLPEALLTQYDDIDGEEFGCFAEGQMRDFADRTHALRMQAAPKAVPGEQNTVPAEWLEQAYREGWAACRDAETIGEEAEDWAFGNSTANSRMIDAQQAAPQHEVQEPWGYARKIPGCGWGFCSKRQYEEAVADGDETKKLYATPQPAPAPLSDDVVKDAARYRWLREGNDAKHGAAWHVAVNLYGCEWDAAIDAALAAQGLPAAPRRLPPMPSGRHKPKHPAALPRGGAALGHLSTGG